MTDNLHLAVIGATGRTGVPLVTQALARGYRVRALARSSARAGELLPEGVEIVVGDATDRAALTGLVAGVDLVLDVSGAVRGGPLDYRTAATRPLLDALADQPDTPIVHLTGAGVRHPDDRPKLVDTIVRGVMQVVARRLLDDSTAAVAMVSGSGRRHLVVRGPRLTDEAATGRYRIADVVGPGSGTTVARADLATAILDLVERDPWPTGWPVVSAG